MKIFPVTAGSAGRPEGGEPYPHRAERRFRFVILSIAVTGSNSRRKPRFDKS